jgi:hypothetical protein
VQGLHERLKPLIPQGKTPLLKELASVRFAPQLAF